MSIVHLPLKVAGLCTDTASNMTTMMTHLTDMLWNGCLNHIIQLVVNVSSNFLLKAESLLKDDIMSYKEIPALLNSCKSIAKAYEIL